MANLIDWNTALGIGGTGIFDSRPKDTFGIGYYRVNRVKGTLTELLDLGNEQGLEAFYNMAVTPWFQLTADLQYLDTAYGQPGSSLRLTTYAAALIWRNRRGKTPLQAMKRAGEMGDIGESQIVDNLGVSSQTFVTQPLIQQFQPPPDSKLRTLQGVSCC